MGLDCVLPHQAAIWLLGDRVLEQELFSLSLMFLEIIICMLSAIFYFYFAISKSVDPQSSRYRI